MRSNRFHRVSRFVSVAAGVSASLAGANANVSEVVLSIEASNAEGTGHVSFSILGGTWNAATKTYEFHQAAPLSILDADNGSVIATINSADVFLKRCSEIDVNFSVDAGASLTNFVIRSPLMSFAGIPSNVSQAKAYARLDATDLNSDGATLTGLGPTGTGAFHANYNGVFGEGGAQFSHLVASVMCGPGGSGYGQQNDPPSGYRAMNADVSDMSVYFGFSLTAGDRCIAASRFDVNPDPVDCPEDSDGDGVPDWLDGCPNDPAKTSPGACGCGHADVDTDADGIPDCLDNCPTVANPDQADSNHNGIGDACESPDSPPPSGGGDSNPGDSGGGSNPAGNGGPSSGDGSNPGDGSAPHDNGSQPEGGGSDAGPQSQNHDGSGVVAGITAENPSGSDDQNDPNDDAVATANGAVSSVFHCGAGGVGLAPLGVLAVFGARRRRML